MNSYIKNTGIFFLATILFSCKNMGSNKKSQADSVSNVIPLEAIEVTLFDGQSLNGWHGYNKTPGTDIKNWTIIDSALVCLGAAKDAHGGDLVTDRDFENFELSWEWKVDKGSNSGVMYHVVEDPKRLAPYETGPEYQIIDDIGFPEKLADWQKAGADYAMHPANNKKKLKPVGEWNSSKIIFNNGHVEHWLNGEKIVEFEAWDADWNKKKEAGKWKDYPDYGKAKTGKIALQDHGNKAYYRNIIIKEI
jgi:hypothetical protein